jgi:WD40 repeat protein
MSNAKKPLTEFVNRKDRLENNMFLSGYINRPAGGAGRFESSGVRESVSSSTLKPLSPANQAGSGGLTQSINMAESTFMSTSMYMGQVVTNRFANAGNAAVIPANDRSKNVMYHSQALKAGAGPQTNSKPIKQDIKLFTIPSKVQQYVDNSQNEYKYLEKDVLAEKTKMNAELDSIQKEILLMIQQKRAELNTVFDGYLESFKANIETTKNKMISFKDTSEWVKMQNSENGDRPVRLTDIAYYSKDAKEGVYKSYKKEAHKNICELRNLKQEVQKHNLEFFVAELERMGIHYPTFANTASSAEFLSEIKDRLFGSVRSGMEDFHKLAYSAPFVSFNEVYSEPHILTSLGESRLNCLINIRDISVTPYTSSKHHELSHEQEVTTLLNIDDESIATGDKAGSIHVYNLTQNKETHKFKMKGVTQITSLGRIRTTYELVAGGEQMVTSQMFDEKEKHDRNIFLISGHAKPDCFISIWDLKKQAFVKQLKGHTDDITSITSLQDGHTLLTGSKSGATLIYNIIKKKPIKSIQNLVNSPVNCIYTFNDLARFAIGHNNGEITICSIMYEIGVQDKMAVCSSAAVKCTLKSKSPVLCINESHTNPNTAITGHADGKLRIWDLSSAKIIKEFEANKSPIMATLVIENPFGLNLEENYHIVSCGDTSEDISIHQPKQEKHCPLDVHAKFNFKSSMGHNPRLQMIRREADAVHFAAFSNEDNKKEIVLVTVK